MCRNAHHIYQYLYWDSSFVHPLEHKLPVVHTLVNSAEDLVTTEEHKKKMSHIKKVLCFNGYQHWVFNPSKKTRDTGDGAYQNK